MLLTNSLSCDLTLTRSVLEISSKPLNGSGTGPPVCVDLPASENLGRGQTIDI